MSRKQNLRKQMPPNEMAAKISPKPDWRDTKTAEQCLSHLCLSENLSDIKFTFQKNQHIKLPAHKFVLSMRSAVFEAMFYSSLAECGEEVWIEDIDAETMKVVLRFVYSDKPDINGNNVLGCLYAAKKYALVGLIKMCSSFLENNIDCDNVCSIYEQAAFYDMKPLGTKCFDFMLENASEVFASKGFEEISHATLLSLLKSDELSAEEVEVFNAAVRWSTNDCKKKNILPVAENKRRSLGDALFQIRFPIIPVEEFARDVTPDGILTDKEQVLMYQFSATKGSSSLGKFIQRERSGASVTIDLTVSQEQQQHGYMYGQQSGYILKISRQDNNLHGGIKALHLRQQLKVKSITGTFVKNVKTISQGNVPVSNFRKVGNKIVFKDPIKVVSGNVIQFHSEDSEGSFYQVRNPNCISNYINIQQVVNGLQVSISLSPAGAETIAFIKCK